MVIEPEALKNKPQIKKAVFLSRFNKTLPYFLSLIGWMDYSIS